MAFSHDGTLVRMQHDGNGWVRCGLGHRHWGRFGAAGLLLVDREAAPPRVLLQHRAEWTASGGTWGVPGGARDSHETAVEAALRETTEETGVPGRAVRSFGDMVDDHGGWSYATVLADLVEPVTLLAQEESVELEWVPVDHVDQHPSRVLHPGFAATWPRLRAQLETLRAR